MGRLFSGSKIAAVAMAFATVLGICSVAGGPSAGAATVPGIVGNTIRIGGVFDSTSFSGTQAGFMARIDRANRTHELGKYKIDVVGIDDDQASSTTDLTDVQNLVERQNVFALAPVEGEGFQQPSATFAAAHHVEYFGSGFVSGFCSPNTYGISSVGCAIGGTSVAQQGPISLSKALGIPLKKFRVAFAGLAIPDGATADAAYADVVKHYGGKVVYDQASIPVSGGNLAPVVNAIEATKPNIIWPVVGAQAIGFEAAVTASGYTGAVVDSALYSPGILKIASVASAINHTYKVATTPVLEENTPYVQQLDKDYTASGSSPSAITFGGLYAYMTADLMIAGLKKVAPNFGDLHELFIKGFNYTSPFKGGFPYKYPFMFNAPTDCDSIVYVQGTVFQVKATQTCSNLYLSTKK